MNNMHVSNEYLNVLDALTSVLTHIFVHAPVSVGRHGGGTVGALHVRGDGVDLQVEWLLTTDRCPEGAREGGQKGEKK